MESRMDKYYKSDISDCSRSKRNSKLYKDIYGDYSNLERLPISENSSEINMSDLNKMISSREEYKKAKELSAITNKSIKLDEEVEVKTSDNKKVYDINELIEKARMDNAKAKEMMNKDNRKHSFLDELEVSEETVKKIKEKHQNLENEENLEKTVINTSSLPLDILSDLKPSGNTVVMEPMKDENKKTSDDIPLDKAIIDNMSDDTKEQFYSNSYSFTKDDFFDDDDELKSSGHVFIKILIVILLIAIIAGALYIIFNVLQ